MLSNQYPTHIIKELDFTFELIEQSEGLKVKQLQEWLSFHQHHLSIDGKFGPATKSAVCEFQEQHDINSTGIVDQRTWRKLTAPLLNALADINGIDTNFDAATLTVAKQHLAQHPLEIGGDNRGPWVRTYMNGNDGANWLWCAGFVSFILNQVALQLNKTSPVKGSFSCDSLATQAQKSGRFISGKDIESGAITSRELGSTFLFLVRRSPDDWEHTGIGFDLKNKVFKTVEGNTNDEGNRNGYEVCSRTRSVSNKDFIVLT